MSITVQVRQGNLEQAMRVLKKKVQREGIIKDFRARSVYEKPSAKKRRKKKEGIANWKKAQKEEKIENYRRIMWQRCWADRLKSSGNRGGST